MSAFARNGNLRENISKAQEEQSSIGRQMEQQGIKLNAIQEAKAKLLDQFLRESANVEAEALKQNEDLYKENQALREQLIQEQNDHALDLEQMDTKLEGMELYAKELKAELEKTKALREQENRDHTEYIALLEQRVAELEKEIPNRDVMEWLRQQLDKQKKEYKAELDKQKK